MKFTDKYISNLKPDAKQYVKRESSGFAIRVLPSGFKTWLFIYTLAGKRRQMNLGDYPDISLAKARERIVDARQALKDGKDPQESGFDWHKNPKREREEAARRIEENRRNPSVESLVKSYLEGHAKVNKKSWREDQRCLEREVIPLWGSRKANEIRKRDVVVLLEGIVDRGSPVMANNTFEKIRKMFNWAVEKDILEATPCYGVKKPTKKEHKDRVLNDKEIVKAWHGLDSAAMSGEICRALKLILVTAQRPGEVIGMHRNEIDGKWWTIPAERAKNGKAHRVFLTPTALELIGNKVGYIFESPRKLTLPSGEKVAQPMDVNAVAYAVRRNLEEPNQERQEPPAIEATDQDRDTAKRNIIMETWTPHDLRRTAATNMSALGYTDEIIDAVLNHVKKGVVAIYNHHRYDREKQLALEAWDRKLRSIVFGKTPGKVVSIRTQSKKMKTA